jgi:UDP-glucose:(heptosyl)LPS alpha-1,3-glucosyltransferase
MRLTVVSPFLDRQHGTELCITEQIERFALKDHWIIDLYSQRISQLSGVRPASESSANSGDSISWHKVSDIPGPHVLKYVWWFFANHWYRWRDRRSGRVCPDLIYSPGVNCLDADVVVVHMVFRAFYERMRSTRAVTGTPLRNWPGLVHRELYHKLIMFLERKIYCNPRTRLIAVSGLVATQLRSYFQRDDVTVIPNAVDGSRFNPETRISKRNTSRHLLSYAENDFVLLLIGNDWRKKGLGTLLKAIALLKDFPLRALVVGNDDPKTYYSLLDQLCLRNQVHFEKTSTDVLTFYAAADVYAGPSIEDAFNLPILEAMACGLPVIASSQAGASEMVHDGKTGVILQDPQDHLELADLIRRIFINMPLRQAMGESASRQVLANCSWDENAERTANLLECALQRS